MTDLQESSSLDLIHVASIDAIVNTLYASISTHDSRGPDWERFAALFSVGAPFVRIEGGRHSPDTPGTIEGFIQRVDSAMAQGHLPDFKECEIARRTEVYHSIAHVFSTYERKLGLIPPPGEKDIPDGSTATVRGINAIALYSDGARWWITSMMWADEHEDFPIPSPYLPRS